LSDFTQRLKESRKNKKLTQSEVAKKLEIATSTYSNYEQGTRFPDKETLIKLSKFYEVSIDYLLGETDNKLSEDNIAAMIADDPDLLDFFNTINNNDESKRLFKHTKGLSSKSIKQIIEIIKTFEESN
jgi:transcriptional regulator with XRE-family HTH domain